MAIEMKVTDDANSRLIINSPQLTISLIIGKSSIKEGGMVITCNKWTNKTREYKKSNETSAPTN